MQGLIVPGLFSGFTRFPFRQYFLGFPEELEEAARVDGLGYRGAYCWNAFLRPLVIGQDQEAWTVNFHPIFVAAAVSILPLMLV
ncbi:hypothetical protein ABZY07_14510 [Streptomyces tauricus]